MSKSDAVQDLARALANLLGASAPAPDELVCFPFGLEVSSARALVASGEIPTRKIGRKTYAKRSAILALIDAAPKVANDAAASPHDELAALAKRTRAGARR